MGYEFWEKILRKNCIKISDDPECLKNLIYDPEFSEIKDGLITKMTEELKAEGDPRIFGNGDIFEFYLYSKKNSRNFYERFMAGEDVKASWINQSDIEKERIK